MTEAGSGHVTGAAPAKRRSDLATRALAGVAMIVVALVALWRGGWPFWLLASAAAVLMMAEWAGMARASRWRIMVALAFTALMMIGPVFMAASDFVSPPPYVWEPPAWCLAAALILSIVTWRARLGLGLLYVTLPVMALVYLRWNEGIAFTLWTLAIVWATDIGAYFSGRAIGGPKLAPALSPNKTWAGLGGGMVAALIVGAAIAAAFGLPRALLVLGAPMAVLAQIGDLFESFLKRKAGVKDSGRLLPGHGGALDRLDGVVPVATLIGLLAATGLL